MSAPSQSKKRRRWPMGRIVVMLLVAGVLATGAVLTLFPPTVLFGDPEMRAINRTRAANLARAACICGSMERPTWKHSMRGSRPTGWSLARRF